VRRLWEAHPNLFSWLALAAGMVIIVIIAARDVGFAAGQWAAVITATIALAGLCVWIVSWEDKENGRD
jgi:CHASE2 domain-containing sensor protein